MKSLFFLFSYVFFSITCCSQEINNEISEGEVKLDDQFIQGYETRLKFPKNEIERSFWKYCQPFAKTTNYRAHYEASIPTEAERILVLAQMESTPNGQTNFSIALKQEAQRSRYEIQLKEMLRQFIIQVYLDQYQMEIDLLEARAASIATKNMKAIKDSGAGDKGHLFALRSIYLEIEEIRKKQLVALEWK